MQDSAPRIWTAANTAFYGGVSIARDPRDVEDNQASYALNALLGSDGRFSRRPGLAAITLSGDRVSNGVLVAPPAIAAAWLTSPYDGSQALIVVDADGYVLAVDPATGQCTAISGEYGDDGINQALYPDRNDPYTAFALERFGEVIVGRRGGYALGRAYFSEPVAATVVIDDPVCIFSAIAPGEAGNDIVVSLADNGPGKTIEATIDAQTRTITVQLATDSGGSVTSTYIDVWQAISAAQEAAGAYLLDLRNAGDSTAVPGTYTSSGGADAEPTFKRLADLDFDALRGAVCSTTGRVFLIDAYDRTSIRYSDLRDASSWPAANVLYGDRPFTGIVSIGSVMVLLQEDRVLRIDGTDPATWQVSEVPANGLGLPDEAWRTLIELEGVAVYASPMGLVAFNGTRPTPISGPAFTLGDSERSLVPCDTVTLGGARCVNIGEHLLVLMRRDESETWPSVAGVYRFREDAWEGIWQLPGEASQLVWSSRSGACAIMADGSICVLDGSTDSASSEPFSFQVVTKKWDSGRRTTDKIAIEMRIGYEAAAATSFTAELVCEGETKISHTFDVDAGEGVVVKRVPHVRCRDFCVKVTHADDCGFELRTVEVDHFFVKLR